MLISLRMRPTQLRLIAFVVSIPFALAAQPLAFAQEAPQLPPPIQTTTSTTVSTTTAVTTAVPGAPVAAPPVFVVPPPPSADPSAPQWALPVPTCEHACEKAVPVVVSYRSTPRYGMVISGATVFGALYLWTTIPMLLATDDLKTALPIVGPWILASSMSDRGDQPPYKFLLALDGVAQAAMLALFIGGLASRRQTPVYEKMLLLPSVNPAAAGLTAIGRF